MYIHRKPPILQPVKTPLEAIQSGQRSFKQAMSAVTKAFDHARHTRTPEGSGKDLLVNPNDVLMRVSVYSLLLSKDWLTQPDLKAQEAAVAGNPALGNAFNEMVQAADFYNQQIQVPIPAQTWRRHQENKKTFG